MIGTKRFFSCRQRVLVEWLGLCIATLDSVKLRQVVHHSRNLTTQTPSRLGKRALAIRECFSVPIIPTLRDRSTTWLGFTKSEVAMPMPYGS